MYLHWNLDSTTAYKSGLEHGNETFPNWKKTNFFLCNFSLRTHENMKKPASKVAHNRPQTFFSSTGPAAQTSPELIFHIIKMSQDPSVSLFALIIKRFFVDFHRNLPKPASRLSPMTTTETLLTSKKEVTLIESLMNWKVYKKFDTFAVLFLCYVSTVKVV